MNKNSLCVCERERARTRERERRIEQYREWDRNMEKISRRYKKGIMNAINF